MIAGVALAAVNTQDDSLTAANLTGAKKKRRDNPSGLGFDLLGLIFFVEARRDGRNLFVGDFPRRQTSGSATIV